MKKRKNRKKKMTQILIIVGAVLVVVIIVAAVILLLRSIKTLKSITITPNFAETELDVDQDYVFTIKGNPAKASLKNLKYTVDDSTASFSKGSSETNTAVLHTGAEGTVTLYVTKDKVKSNVLTFQVVDLARQAEAEAAAAEKAAQEAQLAAEAAAQEMEEAEAVTMVMVTGDNVRMRAEPNTDCEIVKTCKKGETFTKIETVDDWTKVDNGGRECYIKSEFLKEVTEEEAGQAATDASQDAGQDTAAQEKKQEEKKQEEKKQEEKKAAEDAAKAQTDAAKAQADAEAAAQAAAQAQADAAAVAQAQAEAAAAAAAAQQASAGTVTINCADGPAQFTKAEYDYFVATWNYTGMPEEMMTHHSAGELHTLYNNTH